MVSRRSLFFLSVCDAESGEHLFFKEWRWDGGSSSSASPSAGGARADAQCGRADAHGVGNLVRSFFQIASQIDHGMVSRVVFESAGAAAAAGARMQMLCTKNDRVVVAIFHADEDEVVDGGDAAMRQLVEQARELWRCYTMKHRKTPQNT
ncbi:hypothetical protein M885DRAFT_518063 [Pelagophyceae sp. CCMP2097]|nr:hypothetical protein M885DRAFT_518063 [Pelagophyceae sp. CCMP2097]